MSAHVLVRVPGKINLQLSVGPLQKDGFHPVATVFQAVSIFDDVKVELNDDGLVHVQSTAKVNNHLPLDKENLAVKAVELMRKKFSITDGITITLTKEIPIAGGMDALFNLGLKRNDMEKIGAELGADVPFTISGGTAIGTGKGDQITPVLSRGTYSWVLALSSSGLSTPAVYSECDRLREGLQVAPPQISDALLQALSSGDSNKLGKALSNDLQAAACSLKPALRLILDVGLDYGALGGIVSGSGPSVAFLAEHEDHALDLVVALTSSGVVGNVVRASGPVPGARVVDSL